jgi:ketosteroid isomerase-like protein
MAEAVSDTTLAVAGLRAAVEELADALASADLDRLLACEARIESALAQLPTHGLPADARAEIRSDIEAARRAMMRCRRLGLSLNAFILASLSIQGRDHLYGPDSTVVSTDLHSLDLRV